MRKATLFITALVVVGSLASCRATPTPTPTPRPLPTQAAPTPAPPTPVPPTAAPTALPAAQPLAKPAGKVLFTITGDLKLPNEGKTVTIAKDDLLQWPILVVIQVGGKDLTAEQGGPAKLAFPPEAAARYGQEAWLRAIKTIEIR